MQGSPAAGLVTMRLFRFRLALLQHPDAWIASVVPFQLAPGDTPLTDKRHNFNLRRPPQCVAAVAGVVRDKARQISRDQAAPREEKAAQRNHHNITSQITSDPSSIFTLQCLSVEKDSLSTYQTMKMLMGVPQWLLNHNLPQPLH